VLTGTNLEVVNQLRSDIRDFKERVEKVIVMWTANTEESIPDIATLDEIERMIN